MRRLWLVFVLALLMLSLVSGEPHPDFPAFGAPQSGFSVSAGGDVSVNDDAVYKTGYYSMGGAWQTFGLTGNAFSGASDWLTGSSSAGLSGLPAGNVYVITYSCSRVNNAWDCHGGQWQLQITEIGGVVETPTCDDGIRNGDETGVDCGGSCEACVVVPCEDCTFEPEHLRVMWEESQQTDTSMNIIWEEPTNGPSSDTVYYSTSSNGCVLANYPNTVQSTSSVFSQASTRIHVARLRGLQANTLYYFCIASDSEHSLEYSFRTAPSSGGDFTFVMGGDTQGSGGHQEFKDVTREAMAQEPLFILHSGDGSSSASANRWNTWLDAVDQFKTPSGRLVPIIPSVGNHDIDPGSELVFWRTYYTLPGNELNFYHDIGDLRVITLYIPERERTPSFSDQLPFLESALREAQSEGKWTVAQYHKPMYPTYRRTDYITQTLRERIEPLFDEYRLHLALEGHDHVYKRTYPMYNSEISDAFTGTVHIGDGCWAVCRSDIDDGNLWALEEHGFETQVALVDIPSSFYSSSDESTWMHVRVINPSGTQIDETSIPK